MSKVGLYIATNVPEIACIDLLYRDPECVPSWVRVCTDPVSIMAMPADAKCIGVWRRHGNSISVAEGAFMDRREVGDGFSAGLTFDDFEKLIAWRDRKVTTAAPAVAEPDPVPSRDPDPEIIEQRWV